jgi:putative transposase
MEYKTNNNVVYSCKYHVVWCPKYRKRVLDGEVYLRLGSLLREKAAQIDVDVIELKIMPDHVHLLIEVDPQFGINKAVRSLKGYSAHALRKEFRHLRSKLPCLWTNSYFVSTAGGAPLKEIQKYIENQERQYKPRKN